MMEFYLMLRLSAIFAISITLLSGCHPNPTVTIPTHQFVRHTIRGTIERPTQWRLAAASADIQPFATVALLYPSDHAEHPGNLVASGRSDANGHFDFQIPEGTTLATNGFYILEASRRLGPHGTESQSLRTLLFWTGSAWSAVTSTEIVISAKTTALVQALELDSSLAVPDVLGRVTVSEGATTFSSSAGTYSIAVLEQLAEMVNLILEQGRDPIAHLGMQAGQFYVKKPSNPQIPWLNSRTDCPSCNLQRENLNEQDLSGKDLRAHDLRLSQLNRADLSYLQAENTLLNGAYLNESNLTGADLTGADLSDTQLLGANFTHTNFTGSNLIRANLTGADLRTATLTNANFSEAHMNGANLAGVVFPALNLNQAHMRGANLQGANLTGKQLMGTDLRDADLRNANLGNIELNEVNLEGARLEGANLYAANLTGTSFFQASLDAATWLGGQTCATPSRTVCRYEWLANKDTVGNQRYPSIASAADGSSIIVWNNGSEPFIVAQRYDPYGKPIGDIIEISQTLAQELSEPDVGMADDGRFVITWDHDNDGGGWGIIARHFNADGTPANNEFIVNAPVAGEQWYPATAMSPDGRFIVAWLDYSLSTTYYRRFDADGSPKGGQSVVSANSQHVDVTANNDYFAFSWSALDASGYGVYARLHRHDDSGTQFSSFPLNAYTNNHQWVSSIALAKGMPALEDLLGVGNYLVAVWQSGHPQDGNGTGIFGRYMNIQPQNATGLSNGNEFQVNTHTTADQQNPSVSIDPTGNFIVAWQSAVQDGSPNSIYAQRFNARYGSPIGPEFKVNDYSIGEQLSPVITLSPNRHVRVAWMTEGQDGDGMGIAATQFGY
jgi:uncharacterized protein YjbI with pentapeptide repeats